MVHQLVRGVEDQGLVEVALPLSCGVLHPVENVPPFCCFVDPDFLPAPGPTGVIRVSPVGGGGSLVNHFPGKLQRPQARSIKNNPSHRSPSHPTHGDRRSPSLATTQGAWIPFLSHSFCHQGRKMRIDLQPGALGPYHGFALEGNRRSTGTPAPCSFCCGKRRGQEGGQATFNRAQPRRLGTRTFYPDMGVTGSAFTLLAPSQNLWRP